MQADKTIPTNRQISARLRNLTFVYGPGSASAGTACLLSAVNHVKHPEAKRRSDRFGCPVLSKIAIRLNDGVWESNKARTDALHPYVAKLLHARVSHGLTRARALICFKFAVNRWVPLALDVAAKRLNANGEAEQAGALAGHAVILRALDCSDLQGARMACRAATYATYAANAADSAATYATYAANAADSAATYATYATGSTNATYAAIKRKLLTDLFDALLDATE